MPPLRLRAQEGTAARALVGWGLAAMKMISIDRAGQGCAGPGRYPGPRTPQARLLRHHLPGRHPCRPQAKPSATSRAAPTGDARRLQVVPVAHDAGECGRARPS
jgi:hypothetical protein